MVNIVFGDGQLTLDQIIKLELVLDRTGGAKTQYPRTITRPPKKPVFLFLHI